MVSNSIVRHMTFKVIRHVSYKVVRYQRTLRHHKATLLDTIGHVSDSNFVRQVSDKSPVSYIPLLPLGI